MSTAELHVARTRTGRAGSVEGPLRLTRRGRIVVGAVLLLALCGGLVAFGPTVLAMADGDDARPTTVVVHPGETLWEIAGRVNPDGDVRATVDDLAERNDISDAGALRIGTELEVARY